MVILIVVGACAVIAGFAWLHKYFASKKIDGDAVADKVVSYANVAEAFATAISPFLPPAYGPIVSTLSKFTYSAVSMVEALWKASVLPDDKRKATATSLIQSDLQKAGITIDDNVNKWISVAVDLMVRFLPKSHTDAQNAPAVVPSVSAPVTSPVAPAPVAAPVAPAVTVVPAPQIPNA